MPLRIGPFSIDQLSGPIHYYYLKPDPTYMEQLRAQGVEMPIFLLFGDHHYSTEEQCEPCPEATCSAIYDTRFLQALDEIAAITPVDFYTELSLQMFTVFKRDNQSGILFTVLADRIVECLNRTRRSIMQTCPAPRIRWHYSDTRFMLKYVEGYTTIPLSYFISGIHDVYKETNQLMVLSIVDILPEFRSDLINEVNPDLFQKALPHYASIIQLLIYETNPKTCISKIIHEIFKTLKEGPSAIYKQLAKISIPEWHTDGFFRDYCIQDLQNGNLVDVIKYFQERSDETKQLLLTYFDTVLTTETFYRKGAIVPVLSKRYDLDDFSYALLIIKGIITTIHATLVDIYFVLRSMKPPTDGLSPTLSVGFFGADHSRNIAKMLQTLFHYPSPVFESSKPRAGILSEIKKMKYRCLPFKRDIDLLQDAQKHHAWRFPGNPRRIQNYYTLLQQENKGRKTQTRNRNRPLKKRRITYRKNQRNDRNDRNNKNDRNERSSDNDEKEEQALSYIQELKAHTRRLNAHHLSFINAIEKYGTEESEDVSLEKNEDIEF